MDKKRTVSVFFALLVALLLAGCGTFESSDGLPRNYQNIDVSNIPNAVPKVEPKSKYGNPPSYVALGNRYHVMASSLGYSERGIASWYGVKFHKKRTSSGDPYDMYGMTAAHKTLPLPTYVRVTNLQNGRWVIVKVNDRGPFHENRIIDLSFSAAKKLNMLSTGTALVQVEAIDPRHLSELPPQAPPASYVLHKSRIYLQIGAFSSRESAEQLVKRLKPYAHRPVHIVMDPKAQPLLYKVKIGPMANVAETDQLSSILTKKGFAKPYVVVQ